MRFLSPGHKARDVYLDCEKVVFDDIEGEYHVLSIWDLSNSYYLDKNTGLLMCAPSNSTHVESVKMINEIFIREDRNNLDPKVIAERSNRFFIYLEGFYYLDKNRIIEILPSSQISRGEIDAWNNHPNILSEVQLNPELFAFLSV